MHDLSRGVKVIEGRVVGFIYARDGGGAPSALSANHKFLDTIKVVAGLADADGVPGGQAVGERLFSTATATREHVIVWTTKNEAFVRTGTRLQVVSCNVHNG